MRLTKCCLLSTLLLALPVGAFAQNDEENAETFTATMVVSSANGQAQTYTITDFSVSASNNYSGYGLPQKDVSASLNLVTLPDTAMLQWMKSVSSPDSARNVVITVAVTNPGGKTSDMKYALDAARITSFSASHSSYSQAPAFYLQIAAESVAINGVSLK